MAVPWVTNRVQWLVGMQRTTSYLVGMPHLSFVGLSENWLLKHCGDLHWSMLAERMGFGSSDFRDAQGRRLYAAFVAIQLEECRLEEIREDDRLEIVSELSRISRTQTTVTASGCRRPIAPYCMRYFTQRPLIPAAVFLGDYPQKGPSNVSTR